MAETNAQIPQHRGVSEVTLPARDGQFGSQVLKERICNSQVALRVLKVDGVHLNAHMELNLRTFGNHAG